MSYLKTISSLFRLDKLLSGVRFMVTADILLVASYYFMIMFNLVMIAATMYVLKWVMFITC